MGSEESTQGYDSDDDYGSVYGPKPFPFKCDPNNPNDMIIKKYYECLSCESQNILHYGAMHHGTFAMKLHFEELYFRDNQNHDNHHRTQLLVNHCVKQFVEEHKHDTQYSNLFNHLVSRSTNPNIKPLSHYTELVEEHKYDKY